ncbi:MAG: YibE/F family protein [Polyangiaceae bacterium]|nr:YibE/F family protein [Polyangiaceae bacterium]
MPRLSPRLAGLRRPDVLFVLVCALACVALAKMPTGFEAAADHASSHAKAKVVAVNNVGIRHTRLIKTGTQVLTATLQSGPFKGKTIEVLNELKGSMEVDEIYRPGHSVLVEYAANSNGVITAAYARGKYRLDLTLVLLGMFGLLLVVTAGMTGLKALLSFGLALLTLWKVLYPAILRGHDPIVLSLGVTGALIGTICFLVGGLTRKGLVAFLGSALGLLLTCALSMLFTRKFGIHGAVQPFATSLLYAGYLDVNLTRLFMSSIFIAASGALMDVAMDIAAAMDEIHEKTPDLALVEHIRSGLSVGKAVIGTMTTTLLLAYSGSYSAMLMVFMGQGVPLANVFNLSHVSGEVLHTLVGSFGLVAVAPFTALVGGFVYRWRGGRTAPGEIRAAAE